MIKDDQVDETIRRFVREQTDIVIDRYSSSGSNSELYFGQRKVLGDRVALKFYYYNSSSSSHQEPLLFKEIRHENILEIFDAKIICNQYAYFLTPEISGGDLYKFMGKNVVSTFTAINIIQGILKGLSTLHSEPNNFVHRDLKPNNILINSTTKCPYIADFGSIKKIPESKDSVVASKNTFIYKPYESLIDNIYTKQSDIYQVGLILYQLLNGYFPIAPFDWLSDRQKRKYSKISGSFEQWEYIEDCISRKIVGNNLLDNNSLPIYIDTQLKRIINSATTNDLSKRFASCTEFLKALFDYSKDHKDWRTEDLTLIAFDNKQNEYRIYEGRKGHILETKIKDGNWRKNNKYSGLSDIISHLI